MSGCVLVVKGQAMQLKSGVWFCMMQMVVMAILSRGAKHRARGARWGLRGGSVPSSSSYDLRTSRIPTPFILKEGRFSEKYVPRNGRTRFKRWEICDYRKGHHVYVNSEAD
ncbi:hypothetical protein Zmor_003131 [Zophobas morio]|uniref:Uncharacterized protein n=1 Tax=Zophobas morio TaxID=2755281 RepID=A0AA38HRI2_9CUCU|nr:hypothetical protein Zmor_003131 [Zophobas morio]